MMKLFKISALLNDYLDTIELIQAKNSDIAIEIFKKKHSEDKIEHIKCEVFTLWGWWENGRGDSLVE